MGGVIADGDPPDGDACRPLRAGGGTGLPDRRAGARARAARPAPRRRRAGLRTATLVSGYQGSPLGGFDKEVARLGALAAEHELVAAPGGQRGARRDLRLGLAARRHAARPALRRRARRLVRQGARRRPRGRRDPPRQLRRHRPARRRARAVRRRPGLQVLDDPRRVRGAARRAARAGARARAACRRRSTSAATRSPARARRGCGRR